MNPSFAILIGFLLVAENHGFPTPQSGQNTQSTGEMDATLYQGDIRIPPRTASTGRGLVAAGNTVAWPNGLVPYEFATGYTVEQQNTIVGAMRLLETLVAMNGSACVRFRPRISTDPYYIRIVNGAGCSSYVGMNAGVTMERTVTLQSSGCLSNGTIMHEFLHTLGFYHEQSRYDRDNYITINYANIQSGMESQFERYDESMTKTYNYPYDYNSVMHYSAYAFSSNGLPTITPRDNAVLGQRTTLSTNDIRVVRLLYNCSANGVTIPTPTAPTTVNIYTVNATARASLTTGSPRFTRYSGYAGNFYYQAFQVTVPASGLFRFASISNVDSFGYVYSPTFAPSSAAVNLVAFDDDSGSNGQFRFTLPLQSNTNYILVVTTYGQDVTGDINVLVSGLTGATVTPINTNSSTTTRAPISTLNNGSNTIYSSILSASSSTFTRSGGSGSFYFEAIQVTVTVSGNYIFLSSSSMDDYGYLYQTRFDAYNPANNIIASDDDSGGSLRFRFNVSLQAGTTYILIITTFGNSQTGGISVTVSGPAQVTLTRLNVGSASTRTTPSTTQTTTIAPLTSSYSSTLSSGSSTFSRRGMSGVFYFEAIQVTATVTGLYTFLGGGSMDDYGYLYRPSFDPSNPANNVIALDDDSGGALHFQFSAALQAGTTYILVITTFSAGVSGSISVTVSGPSRATLTRLNVGSASTTTTPSTTRTTTVAPLTASYSSALSTSSSMFTRYGGSSTYYFEAIQVTVTVTGLYTFQSGSSMDDYGYLYQVSFSASNPASNIIALDDDSGGSARFRFSATLQVGTTYILVITTYSAGASGSISVNVTGPAQATLTRLSVASAVRTTTAVPTTTTLASASFAGTLTSSSSRFTRSGEYSTFYYVAVQVTISVSGTYTFLSGSSIDDFGYLYQTSFSATSPGSNIVASDDDSGGNARFRMIVGLTAGRTYILVITTYSATATGSVSVSVTGPAQPTLTRLATSSASG